MLTVLFKKLHELIYDFSNKGFQLRNAKLEPLKTSYETKIWIDKMGWQEGNNKLIVRCYEDGFSFWRGKFEDEQEWFCKYVNIVDFKQPLGLKFADPIVVITYQGKLFDCMLGGSANYIKEKWEESIK